ncbi:hypothetical protein HZH66_005448 [Vespula vulgaris]|uniref:Uncharacterized protein n=1 Tax=Vespula vulgaris TaxID=7454 RepID=A0A834N9U9_VESVU|nr:hypothetical protein HZH66_005448 [Vespula vulgaris]
MLCFETAALHGNGNGRILNWQDIKMYLEKEDEAKYIELRELRNIKGSNLTGGCGQTRCENGGAVGRAALFNEKQRIGPYSDDYSPFTEPTCEKGTRYGKVIEATRGFQYVGEY